MPEPAVPREWSQIVLFRTLLLSHASVAQDVKKLLADQCGLSMMQFDMIAELGATDGMRMGDLGAKMITSPSSVTRVAQSLEKQGLVKRQRSEESERVVLARLTEKGEQFFTEHFLNVASGIATLFDSKLDSDEQQQLGTLLSKLTSLTR